MATPNVQYVLSQTGILDIIPSPGKQVTVNGGTGDGTLSANEVNATNILKIGTNTEITLGTLSGTIRLGNEGAIMNSTGNQITGLTSLTVNAISNITAMTMKSGVESNIYVGSGGRWKGDSNGTNTLSGITSVSGTTLTDGVLSITGGNITSASNVSATTATIGSVSVSGGGISSVESISMTGSTSRILDVATITTKAATTESTITNGSGQWISPVGGLTSTISGITSLSSSTLTDNVLSITGGDITNASDISATTATIAGVGFLDNNITSVNSMTTNSVIVGSAEFKKNASNQPVITGLDALTSVSITASGTLQGETIQNSGNFLVSHNTETNLSTASSNILTDGTLSIQSGEITNLNKLEGTDAILTRGTIGGCTLSGTEISGVTKLTTGSISGATNVSSGIFTAESTSGTSVFNGNLTVKGDLKVVNNSAQVIELTHEKFSTQDPIIEFNRRLDGVTEPAADLNVDFGFINVCDDNGTRKSAGLVSDVTDSSNMSFTFFHSGDYSTTSGSLNNTLPTSYTRANVRCGNVSSDGNISVSGGTGGIENYIAVGNDVTGRTTGQNEVIYANGNVKATGTINSGTGFTTTAGTINVGSATLDGAKIRCDGTIKTLSLSTTNLTQTSDVRKKENVVSIEDGVSAIEKLRPVTFDWKENGKSDIGFIAQEVREVYPELVAEDANGHLSVAYTGVVAPLVRAVQQQQEMIRALEARLAKLEA